MIFHQVINFDDRDAKRQHIARIGTFTGRKEFTYEDWSPRRSGGLNKYYFGVVVKTYGEFVKEHTGESFDRLTLHEDLKRRFLPMRETFDVLTGETTGTAVAHSRTLNRDQFWDYVEAIRAWLAGMNCIIPDPGEYGLRQPARKGAA